MPDIGSGMGSYRKFIGISKISAYGELRGVFGVMIGQIAKAYGIDVEDELADIIPE